MKARRVPPARKARPEPRGRLDLQAHPEPMDSQEGRQARKVRRVWMERLELKACQGSMGSQEGRKVRKEMRGLQAHLDRMARKVRRGR